MKTLRIRTSIVITPTNQPDSSSRGNFQNG
jgi:hypothetical protein